MKTLRLFAAALTLFFSGLLQAQTQVDLTKQVKGVLPDDGGVPAGVVAGSGMVPARVGQPGLSQTKLVVDMREPFDWGEKRGSHV